MPEVTKKRKVNDTPKSKTVREQTPVPKGKPGVKYRCDFKSWDEYNKYKGEKG